MRLTSPGSALPSSVEMTEQSRLWSVSESCGKKDVSLNGLAGHRWRFRGDERTVAEVREGGRSTARAHGLTLARREFSHRQKAHKKMQLPRAIVPMRVDVSSSRDCSQKCLCCHGVSSVVLHSHQGELACQHGLHRDDALASFEEELCTQLINSSVQQLYTRVTVYIVRLRTGSKLLVVGYYY